MEQVFGGNRVRRETKVSSHSHVSFARFRFDFDRGGREPKSEFA